MAYACYLQQCTSSSEKKNYPVRWMNPCAFYFSSIQYNAEYHFIVMLSLNTYADCGSTQVVNSYYDLDQLEEIGHYIKQSTLS